MRHALIAAGLALVAGTTVGCGDSGPPTDASTEEFCGVFEDFYADLAKLGADAEAADAVAALKDVADRLQEIGTPEDISEEARAGFEVTVEAIENIDEDASEEDINKLLEENFSEEEKKQADAFNSYLGETCETG